MRGLAHAAIMMKDFVTLNAILETLPDFRPWMFLSDYAILFPDPDLFYSTLELFDSEGWPFNLNNRFKNDDNLLKFMRHMLGDFRDDVSTTSIPKLLDPVLSTLELPNLHFFQSSDFFTLSDDDRNADFSFIFAFRAVSQVLEAFNGGMLDDEVFDFCVQHSARSEDLAVDLFSLFFLQRDGMFVCPLSVAAQVLGVLVPYTHSQPCIAAGFAKVQRQTALNAASISECFVSNNTTFLSALTARDFTLAEVTAAGDPQLTALCESAKAIAAAVAGGSVTEVAQREWPFVTQEGPIVEPSGNEEILSRRKGRAETEVLAPFMPVDVEPFTRHFETHEPVDVSRASPGLHAFVERFDLFSQFSDSTDDFVSALVQSERVTDWASIEQLLGPDALEKILLSADLTKATGKMINAIAEVSPLVARAITVTKEGVVSKRSLRLDRLEALVDPEFRGVITGRTDGGSSWVTKALTTIHGHERLLFDHFWKYFHERGQMNEDILFAILDLADQMFRCDVPDGLVSALVDAIWLVEPFPIAFAEEIHLRWSKFDENERRLTPDLRWRLFPEKWTQFMDELSDLGIEESNPPVILPKLVESGNLGLATQFASQNGMLESFRKLIVDRVAGILAIGGDVAHFFGEEHALAYGVFEGLPQPLRTRGNKTAILAVLGSNLAPSEVDTDSQRDSENVDLSSIKSIAAFIRTDFPGLSDPAAVRPRIVKALEDLLERISVTDPREESNAFRTLRRIRFLFSQISHVLPIATWVLEFVSRSFSLRFRAAYSFAGALRHPHPLLALCLLYDDIDLLFAAKDAWSSLDLSPYLLHECQLCFSLSETRAASRFIDYQAAHFSTACDVSWVVGVLIHPLPGKIYRHAAIIKVDLTPMDYWVRCITSGELAVAIPRENIEISETVIHAFGGDVELVKCKAAKGDFQMAFAKPLPLDAWVSSVIPTALAYDYWGTLWRLLQRNAGLMAGMREMLGRLFDFLRERRAFRALFDLQNRLGLREDAILTLTDMCDCHESWKERIESMSKLEQLINREMTERRNGKRAQKVSEASLAKFLQIASIMHEFSTSCRKWQIAFDSKQHLFRSDVGIEPMLFFALFYKEFALALKISALKPTALDIIVRKLVETLSYAGNSQTTRYLKEMGDQLTGPDYERLASQIVVAAVEKLRKSEIPQFITGTVNGNDLQVKLLIRFGFLRQAKDICENPKLITLIYNAAVENRDQAITEECRRLLPR
jgi:hypothetical protein